MKSGNNYLSLALLALCVSGCNTIAALPANPGEIAFLGDSPTITGSVVGNTASKLVSYSYLSNQILSEGTLNANGEFSIILPNSIIMSKISKEPFPMCSGAKIKPSNLKIASVSVGIQSNGTYSNSLFYANRTKTDVETSRGVSHLFADQDGTISGQIQCSNQKINILMNLKKGWNQLLHEEITTSSSTTETYLTTLNTLQGLKWNFIGFNYISF